MPARVGIIGEVAYRLGELLDGGLRLVTLLEREAVTVMRDVISRFDTNGLSVVREGFLETTAISQRTGQEVLAPAVISGDRHRFRKHRDAVVPYRQKGPCGYSENRDGAHRDGSRGGAAMF